MLVGDFSTLAVGGTDVGACRVDCGLVWLSGRDIQRETVQHLTAANYVDGYRLLHPAEKGYTFPVWDPHLRLDYVFVPKGFSDRLLECEVASRHDKAITASDHFPLFARLEF